MKYAALIASISFIFFFGMSIGQAQAQAVPAQPAAEIKPAEISLGASSPQREASASFSLKKISPGQSRWVMYGPEGWYPQVGQKTDGLVGTDPLTFKVILKSLALTGIPGEMESDVPVELVFDSPAGQMVFRNNMAPGRYRERVRFSFDDIDKSLDMYFRILKDEKPVLLLDSYGIDFGNVESGKTSGGKLQIRNPGRSVLSWKIRKPAQPAGCRRYISLLNPELREGEPYAAPLHLVSSVQLKGDWSAIEGYALGRRGSSVQVNFTGTGITVYGAKDSDPGVLEVNLDGERAADVMCGSGYLEVSEILSLAGLADGPHTLTVSKNDGVLYLEGFNVIGGPVRSAPAGWLKVFPDDGTTQSETDYVNLTINTAGLPPGTYCDEVAVDSNSGTALITLSANVTVSAVPQILKIYRFTRGRDILYSCNPQEESHRKLAGYLNKTLAFRLYREDTPGTRQLFRWYSQAKGNHYYSTSRDGDKFTYGYFLEGPIGNIATSRLPATRELYHWFNPATGMHFYTTDSKGENAARAKYVYQGIVGYVR